MSKTRSPFQSEARAVRSYWNVTFLLLQRGQMNLRYMGMLSISLSPWRLSVKQALIRSSQQHSI